MKDAEGDRVTQEGVSGLPVHPASGLDSDIRAGAPTLRTEA